MSNYVIKVSIAIALMMGISFVTFADGGKGSVQQKINKAIELRRIDPDRNLLGFYKEVTPETMRMVDTWHESDDLLFRSSEYVVYYNDSGTDADYVWTYKITK